MPNKDSNQKNKIFESLKYVILGTTEDIFVVTNSNYFNIAIKKL